MSDDLARELDGEKLYDVFSRILPDKLAAKLPDSSVFQEIGDQYDTVLHQGVSDASGTPDLVLPFVEAWMTAERARGRLIVLSQRDKLSEGLKAYIDKLSESEKRTEHPLDTVWRRMADESFYQPSIKKDMTLNKTAKSGEVTQNPDGLTKSQTPTFTDDSWARSCARKGYE